MIPVLYATGRTHIGDVDRFFLVDSLFYIFYGGVCGILFLGSGSERSARTLNLRSRV
jgi:hypothetical protein